MAKSIVSDKQTRFVRGDGREEAVSPTPLLPVQYPTGAVNGYVWTTDGLGNGSWQASSGGGGGLSLTVASVQTTTYSASANQIVPCDTTSGSFTVTLPNAPAASTLVVVKMVTQGGTNTVTVACAGSDVFNKSGGGTTGTLKLLSQGMFLEYNGSGIWTVLADDLPLSQLDLRYLALSGGTVAGSLAVGGAFSTTPSALTDASSIAVNAALSDVFTVTLGGNRTLASPTNPSDGQAIVFEITQDGTGSRTLAYGAAYSFPASIGTPVLSSTPGYMDTLAFRYSAASTLWTCAGFVPQSVTASAATVSQGGTGQSSLTAYELLAAGTTSTGAAQQIAYGASGTVLMGAGASALPAFTALDSTATDITSTGIQAAGATAKVPDAGHVHPDKYGTLGDLGTVIGWTSSYGMTTASAITPVAGVLYLMRVRIPVGGTTANLDMYVTTNNGATPANVYVALFSTSGSQLAVSANRASDTALTAGGLWTIPWSSSYVSGAQDVYAALLIGSAGTMPGFRGTVTSAATVVNLGTSVGAVNLRSASIGTGQTSMPGSVTMSSLTSANFPMWAACV